MGRMTMDMRSLFLSSFLVALPVAAHAAPTAAQAEAMCQGRKTCKVEKTYDAGKSPSGAALDVVEVRLGLADKPQDQDDGCRTDSGDKDGGVEYWLLDGTAAPRRVLKLCNDGYGASGVGDDEVKVGPNRLSHWQTGGSAWRWSGTVTYSLSPWRPLTERSCSYHNVTENSGTTTDLDYTTMVVRSIVDDPLVQLDRSIGCADWPKDQTVFSPRPEKGILGAYDIVGPILGDNPKIPSGTAIANCVAPMTTAGTNGFVVYGKPAPADQAAEIRAMAIGLKALLIQVYDPLAAAQPAPAAGSSWINLPHVELWVGQNKEEARANLPLHQVQQIGIGLDGKVNRGVGAAAALPAIQRWPARDADGRPVTVLRLDWKDEYALLNGVALVYSQAENGKQARLVSTTGIANNRPLYLPNVVQLTDDADKKIGRCQLLDGRLAISDK